MSTYLALCALKELETAVAPLVELTENPLDHDVFDEARTNAPRVLALLEKLRFEIEALSE